jgi:hypothetical protein
MLKEQDRRRTGAGGGFIWGSAKLCRFTVRSSNMSSQQQNDIVTLRAQISGLRSSRVGKSHWSFVVLAVVDMGLLPI